MTKKLKFLITLILCLTGLFFTLRLVISRYLPNFKVDSLISEAIGLPVSFSATSFNLFPYFELQFDHVKIGDTSSREDHLDAASIRLKVPLRKLLAERCLEVTELEIIRPQLYLTKNADSKIESGGMKRSKSIHSTKSTNEAPANPSEQTSRFLLSSVQIKDGSITFADKTSPNSTPLKIDGIDTDISLVTAGSGFDFILNLDASAANISSPKFFNKPSGTTARFSSSGNFISSEHWSAPKAQLNLGRSTIELKLLASGNGILISSQKSVLDLPELAELSPKLLKLSSLGRLKDALKFEALSQPDGILIKPSSVELFGGELAFDGSLRSKEQELALHASASRIELEKLTALTGPLPVTGTIQALKTSLQQNLSSSQLEGPLSITIAPGQFVGVNVFAESINALAAIPIVGELLKSVIPKQYQDLLSSNSTPFNNFTTEIKFLGSRFELSMINLAHPAYSITGTGEGTFSGDLKLNAQIRFSPELIQSIVQQRPKLRALLDSSGGLELPVVISKSGGRTVVLPDTSRLLKRVTSGVVRDSAEKAIDKVVPGAGKILEGLF